MQLESQARVMVGGLALAGAMYLFDAVYFLLLLLGPLVTGVLLGWRDGRRSTAVGLWLAAGLVLLAYDAVVNREDVVFHLATTGITTLLAWGAWTLASRRRRVAV